MPGRHPEEAAWWASYVEDRWERAGRPFARALLDAALDALHTPPGTQGEQVLVNQDLHAGNVLGAQREPWLVIDPKPLAGEREFGIAAIVRGRELGHSREAVLTRLTRLSTQLGLDHERARRWALAQTLAWSFHDDRVLPGHVEVAYWLHQAA
jgi:streptomycin 6-kinase